MAEGNDVMNGKVCNEKNEVLLHEGDGLMCADALTRCKNAVCLIKCQSSWPKAEIKRGSGFYAKAKICNKEYRCIITNHHVLSCEADARNAVSVFEFEGEKTGKQIALRPEIIFKTNKFLDYTVVGVDEVDLKRQCSNVQPLEYLGQPDMIVGDDIFIFQHPRGCSKKFSYQKVIGIQQPYVYYNADTDDGSSGSPVLRKLQLVALHHKGNEEDSYNKGILFSAIIEDLELGITAGKRRHGEDDVNSDEMEEDYVKKQCVEMQNDQKPDIKHPVSPQKLKIPDNEVLDQLSHECSGFYKHLARRLGVDNYKIEAISCDHINYKNDVEKSYQVLQEWKESECSEVSYSQLEKALRNLHKNKLANKYCTNLHGTIP